MSIAPLTALGKIAILVLFVAAGPGARLAVLDEEFIHALFGLLEALLAGAGQLDAALKRGKRLFQTLFASLHFFNDLLKLGESGFELGPGLVPGADTIRVNVARAKYRVRKR